MNLCELGVSAVKQIGPLDWSPYTSPDLCGDLSEKLVWVLAHPRNYPAHPYVRVPRLRNSAYAEGLRNGDLGLGERKQTRGQ